MELLQFLATELTLPVKNTVVLKLLQRLMRYEKHLLKANCLTINS